MASLFDIGSEGAVLKHIDEALNASVGESKRVITLPPTLRSQLQIFIGDKRLWTDDQTLLYELGEEVIGFPVGLQQVSAHLWHDLFFIDILVHESTFHHPAENTRKLTTEVVFNEVLITLFFRDGEEKRQYPYASPNPCILSNDAR